MSLETFAQIRLRHLVDTPFNNTSAAGRSVAEVFPLPHLHKPTTKLLPKSIYENLQNVAIRYLNTLDENIPSERAYFDFVQAFNKIHPKDGFLYYLLYIGGRRVSLKYFDDQLQTRDLSSEDNTVFAYAESIGKKRHYFLFKLGGTNFVLVANLRRRFGLECTIIQTEREVNFDNFRGVSRWSKDVVIIPNSELPDEKRKYRRTVVSGTNERVVIELEVREADISDFFTLDRPYIEST